MAILREPSRLKSILNIFPALDDISYCFAYGSAIFKQSLDYQPSQSSSASSGKMKSQMIDLVIAVDNPLEWHRANIFRNSSHYSGLRFLGPKWISYIQQHFGARIFYNTLIPIENDYIKYGVISTRDLINDLYDWETFYISGRLHKPTLTLKLDEQNIELKNAIKINFQSALHVALLLQSEQFTQEDLYMTIAGLSYSGDFRMTFGEDRNKIAKIVKPQMDAFRDIYDPLLASDLFKDIVSMPSSGKYYFQNCSPIAIQWHLNLLPKTVQYCLSKEWLAANSTSRRQRNSASRLDLDDLIRRLAFDITYRAYLHRAIESIVFRSSWSQSMKGIFTAGMSKSISYSMEKVNKMIKSSDSIVHNVIKSPRKHL
ncbi:Phosphatidate cytidylyltransferase, mitochondrial [Blomia tropicalis]|nr:Phosphatidate cytidylyltransferase, mitochondrial [Blomia tropicalis]